MAESQVEALSKILNGEPLPLPPEGQSPEIDKWVRDLYNYLRRLMARFTATNIVTTIIQGTFPNGKFAVDWKYDTSDHKFKLKYVDLTAGMPAVSDWTDASGGQPVNLGKVVTDVDYDGVSFQLVEDSKASVYVLEHGATTLNALVAQAVCCTSGGQVGSLMYCCSDQLPPVVRYACVNGFCVETPDGVFTSLAECQAACLQIDDCTWYAHYQYTSTDGINWVGGWVDNVQDIPSGFVAGEYGDPHYETGYPVIDVYYDTGIVCTDADPGEGPEIDGPDIPVPETPSNWCLDCVDGSCDEYEYHYGDGGGSIVFLDTLWSEVACIDPCDSGWLDLGGGLWKRYIRVCHGHDAPDLPDPPP